MSAIAFAPGNVSGIFKIVRDDDPRRMHSLGMGFTVSHGVRAAVRGAPRTEVSFNGEVFEFATVRHVAEALSSRPARISLESELPLSGGFGLSGASALATAFALDAAFGLGLDERTLGMTAHVAEVTNLTGLGDVCGQLRGGCLAKLVPGDPLAAIALPVAEQTVYYRYFSPHQDQGDHRRPPPRRAHQRRGGLHARRGRAGSQSGESRSSVTTSPPPGGSPWRAICCAMPTCGGSSRTWRRRAARRR